MMLSIARKTYLSCGWETPPMKGGFNLTLETYIKGPLNPKSGLIVNLSDLDTVLKDVTSPFDHKHLQKDFHDLNFQSLEDFATHCFSQIQSHPYLLEWKQSSIYLEKLKIHYSPTKWIEVKSHINSGTQNQ